MGTQQKIAWSDFPKQSDKIGQAVHVCFWQDETRIIDGVIVRNDIEVPHETIIRLYDGRFVRGAECMWVPKE